MIWFQMFKRFISTNCFAWAWSKRRVTHFPLSVYYLYQKVTLLITLILDILKSNPLRNRFHVQARTIFNWLVLNVIRDFTSQGHLRLRGQTKPKRALVTCGSACLRQLTCFLLCVLAGSWWQYPFFWLTVVFSLILVSRHLVEVRSHLFNIISVTRMHTSVRLSESSRCLLMIQLFWWQYFVVYLRLLHKYLALTYNQWFLLEDWWSLVKLPSGFEPWWSHLNFVSVTQGD